jgi:hypothetical protein
MLTAIRIIIAAALALAGLLGLVILLFTHSGTVALFTFIVCMLAAAVVMPDMTRIGESVGD